VASSKRISIVFGREDFGLSQEDIESCDSIFYIPANHSFPSYNLAFSVGIICYEIFNLLESVYSISSLELAKKKDIETFFSYLEKYLSSRVEKKRLASTLLSFKRIFLRTHLTTNEVSLLKSSILKKHI
jgi:tRNA C32,U32 (ribose-2'-O)-methylase TrmJ